MQRWILGLTVALACAVGAHAQDTKTKVEVNGRNSKPLTYTGCVQSGTETRNFVVAKVVPVGQTTRTEVATSGDTATTTTTTTYALVPGEKIELQQHVGHKVEVTGVMIPAGNSKVESTTKTERKGSRDTTVKETVKTEGAPMPQFRVLSIKELAETCS